MFSSILVPLSDPTLEHAALHAAVRIARGSAARLHVVHVRQKEDSTAHDPESEALLAAASWAADELDESVSFRSLVRPPQTSHTSAVVQALDTYAAENSIDLIVMARRRHKLERLLFGSVGEHLLFSHDVSILFVPQRDWGLPARDCSITLALDGTQGGESVVPDAIELARALKCSLTLTRILAPVLRFGEQSLADADAFVQEEGAFGEESAQAYLDSVAERIRNAGVQARGFTVASDRVSPGLRRAAANERVHIIALAPRHSVGPLHFPLDSVTAAVLRKGETAVLARRQPPNGVE